ncbi:hypothetical protein S451_22020 [Salmonella enterica subsp. enterica]|nr:hypothetical protein [Salmonella enterica]EAZ0471511.1 hypothetical protein [Salmonella enterica]EBG4358881.1 hypothetical protein [Salmonella enterica subsp. enterica]ECJ7254330.1 hypothetical protein [Salmonella enterica subsp. enterica]
MADISLEQATEKACQVESLLRMIESYPDTLSEAELSAVITLIRLIEGVEESIKEADTKLNSLIK